MRKLQSISEQLAAISENRDGIGDYLDNETGAKFAAFASLIAECRATLDTIEQIAGEELERCTKWHRDCLAGIEALNVLEKV